MSWAKHMNVEAYSSSFAVLYFSESKKFPFILELQRGVPSQDC